MMGSAKMPDSVQLLGIEERNGPEVVEHSRPVATGKDEFPMPPDSSRTPASSTTPTTRVVHVNDRVDGAIYVGRAMPRRGLKGSPFANPYRIGRDGDREACIRKFAADLEDRLIHNRQETLDALLPLVGRPLACWCRHAGDEQTLENACHADVILAVIRAEFGEVRS